jgi:hypothetical protein
MRGYVQNFAKAIRLDPDDKSLVADLVINLYALLMVDEADALIARTQLAAEDPSLKNLFALERARALNDHDQIISIGRRWIEESPADQCCPQNAIIALIRVAAIDGKVPETLEYLDKQVPGFADLQDMELPLQPQIARTRQLHALSKLYTRAELDDYMVAVDQQIRKFTGGKGFERSARIHTGFLVVRGELDEARDIVLEQILGKPATEFLDWREFFRQPAFADLIRDPDIRAGLDRWDEQQKLWRKDVRAILVEEDLI